ncbi:DNA polymerase III subunit delta [Kineococcus rhizosphaerae]|uniref:DNA-directed DNA polymerase n=1 Tax=Kineococcus rhizosphaerae TaxID=559628 RepID=A0A2T0R7U5_9ACTN|nr:DNA polymerase III subunit delta [Kineococcus rhizosphaerae]PRY17236.1 DNA polymerase III delta subunit [Kineococcus rhizosphaerae]
MPSKPRTATKSTAKSAAKTPGNTVAPFDLAPAPVVLLAGSEEALADRAFGALLARMRELDPTFERTDISAAGYQKGQLATWTSPSLFDERSLVLVDGVDTASDAFVEDVLDYLAAPVDTVVLVLRHRGGNKAKKVLETARTVPGVAEVSCQPLKRDQDKVDFVLGDVRRARRRIDVEAARALVSALGSDLGELAAAVDQLLADTDGTVTEAAVHRYHGGRREATGFEVADAAIAGEEGQALVLVRHAAATGVPAVVVVAALASRLRQLAKVAAAGRGRAADLARDLGMAPWLVEKAQREVRTLDPEGLAAAILAVAEADHAVKGGGTPPEHALERAVRVVAAARR